MSDINCDPNALMQASKCMCIPPGKEGDVMIYLLQQIAGETSTPKELMEKAKCYCFPKGEKEAVMTYLLCQIVNGGSGVA